MAVIGIVAALTIDVFLPKIHSTIRARQIAVAETKCLETVGLVTIDGTGMTLSWNKKCDILEPKVYPWGNNTNETTNCVAMLMDINLDKSPNRINKDIALFRAETPHKSEPVCGIQFGDNCFGTPFTPTPLTNIRFLILLQSYTFDV